MKKTRLLSLIAVLIVLVVTLVAVGCIKPDQPAEETKYAVTYSAGEGATGSISGAEYKAGDKFNLPEATGLSKANHTFSKWNDGTADYEVGAEYTMPENAVTFTAVWTEDAKHKVSFNPNNVDEPVLTTVEVYSGSTVAKPEDPTIESGKHFRYWETEDGAEYDFATPVTADITLTAVYAWKVSFDVNGAEGSVEDLWLKTTKPIELPDASGLTNGEKVFGGWSDDEATYQAGEIYTVSGNHTFVAVWNDLPSEYTVTFVTNMQGEGDAPEALAVVENESIELPVNPFTAKEGYTNYAFAGWYVSTDSATLYQAGDTYVVTGNVEFRAKWEKQNYTLTLLPGTGADGEAITVQASGKYDLSYVDISSWDASYSIFFGWAYENGEECGESVFVDSDTTLVAQWLVQTAGAFAVDYNGMILFYAVDDASGVGYLISETDVTYILSYELDGESITIIVYDADYTVELACETGIYNENGLGITLTVEGVTYIFESVHNPLPPMASFDANGGEGPDPEYEFVATENGYTLVLPECSYTAPEGYEFDKWEITNSTHVDTRTAGSTYIAFDDESLVIKALWKAGEVPPTPVFEGVTFTGSASIKGFLGAITTVEKIVLNIDELKIEYTLADGTSNVVDITVEANEMYKPSDLGEDALYYETKINNIAVYLLVKSDLTKMAICDQNEDLIDGSELLAEGTVIPDPTYTLTFKPGDNESFANGEDLVYTVDEGEVSISIAEIDYWNLGIGVQLVGFTIEGTDTVLAPDATIEVTEDLVLVAKWVQVEELNDTTWRVYVNLYREGSNSGEGYLSINGVPANNLTYEINGSDITLTIDVDGEPYVVTGTYDPDTWWAPLNIAMTINGKEYLFGNAQSTKSYTVTLECGDHATGEAITIEVNGTLYFSNIDVSAWTVEDGYQLNGWDDGYTTYLIYDQVDLSGDATFTAVWVKVETYTSVDGNATIELTFDAVEGVYPAFIMSNEGLYDDMAAFRLNEGTISITFFDMNAWDDVEAVGTYGEDGLNITIVYGEYTYVFGNGSPVTVNKYIVTFDPNNEGEFVTVEVEEGNLVAQPEDPTIESGKLFRYWQTDDSLVFDFSTPITSNITLTAIYGWQVSFDVNGAEGTVESVWTRVWVGPGVELPDASDLTYEGKVFGGWTDGETVYQAGDFFRGTANHTLVAVWNDAVVVEEYTVSFSTNFQGQGTAPEAMTVSGNTSIVLPANPFTAKDGYTNYAFVGWYASTDSATLYQAGDSYVVTGNVEFKAKWEKQDYTVTIISGSDVEGAAITIQTSGKYFLYNIDISSWNAGDYQLQSWVNEATGEVCGETIFVDCEITLVAQWLAPKYFIDNGWSIYALIYELSAEYGNGKLTNYENLNYLLSYYLEGETISVEVYPEDYSDVLATATGIYNERGLGITLTVKGVTYTFELAPLPPTATFDANGGEGDAPACEFVETSNGYKLVLPACSYTAPAGYEFDKWEITNGSNVDTRKAGASYIAFAGEELVIKPLWKEVVPVVLTVAQALELANDTPVIVSGVVTSIDTVWSESFGNMTVTITDDAGDSLYVYRLATLVGIGDTITVTGKMGSYNGSKQVAAGATATIDIPHLCTEWTEADCTNAGKCVLCGKENADKPALGHIDEDEDGLCDRCSADLNVTVSEVSMVIYASEGTLDGKSISWSNDNFTVTNNQNKSTNAIRTSDADHFRCYQGSLLTISANGNETIVSVEIKCQNASYANILPASLTTEGATAVVDGTSVVITVKGSSVEFVLTAQTRITEVVISYEA